MSEINKWYSGKNVLVTGATGFVGKCLVEKILRVIDEIGDIYVTIRGSARESFQKRKDNFINHIVFKNLSERNPDALKKIKIIESDLLDPNLNLTDSDRKTLCENVSIIFHCAADVRFDKPLVDEFETNVLGTKRMLDLAENVKNLEVSVKNMPWNFVEIKIVFFFIS